MLYTKYDNEGNIVCEDCNNVVFDDDTWDCDACDNSYHKCHEEPIRAGRGRFCQDCFSNGLYCDTCGLIFQIERNDVVIIDEKWHPSEVRYDHYLCYPCSIKPMISIFNVEAEEMSNAA